MNSINSLESRVDILEEFVGDIPESDETDTYQKVQTILRQLNTILYSGLRYNEQILIYLQEFKQVTDQSEAKVIIEACYNQLKEIASDLQHLDLFFDEEVFKPLEAFQSQSTVANLSVISSLYQRCNGLFISSIQLTMRYMRLINLQNEFCSQMESKLLKIDKRILELKQKKVCNILI